SSVLLLPEVLDPQNRGEVHFCEIKVVAVWRVDSWLARGDNGQIIRQASLGRNRSHKTAEEGCVVKKFLVFLGVAIAFMCSSNWVQAETIFSLTTDNGLLTFESGSHDKTTRIGTITGVLPG